MHDMPLLQFIDRHYAPHVAGKTERRDKAIQQAAAEGLSLAAIAEEFGLTQNTVKWIAADRMELAGRRCRVAANVLRKFLRRQPTVGDLRPETFLAFTDWLDERGGASERKYFTTLWRHAFAMGLVETDPGGNLTREHARLLLPRAEGTLGHFFNEEFKPRLAEESGEQTISRYTRAVEAFERYDGESVWLEHLTEDATAGFDAWLAEQFSPVVAKKFGQFARRVLREARPDVFTRKRGWHRKIDRPDAPEGSIRHFFRTTYRPIKLVGARPQTAEQMEVALNRLYHLHGRELMLEELSDEVVAGLMEWMLAEGLATSTVNNTRGYLCSIWRLAQERHILETLPRVRKLRPHLHEPCSWTAEELKRLLDAADAEQHDYDGIPRRLWWRAFILVGYYTALRRSALLSLRHADLNLETGWLETPPTIQKNRRGKKFRLGPDAIEAVQAIWSPRREFLLPWPHERSTFNPHWKRLLQRAGLPIGRRQGPHKLRRTTATLVAVEAGMHAAMSILGHSEEYMTRLYVDPSKLPGADATQFLPPLVNNAT